MIEQLISQVFYARNVSHWQHWRATGTGSYAKHQALGSFYDDVIEALDSLVEAYQEVAKRLGILGENEPIGGSSPKLVQ